MSEANRCAYCETLPATAQPGWGGAGSKCPLCKQELWAAPGGTTYRLDANAPLPGTRWRWLAGAGAIASIVIVAAIGYLAKVQTHDKAPLPSIVQATPAVDTGDQAVTAANVPWVQAKPGSQSAAARHKPSEPIPVVKPLDPADAVVAAVKTDPPPEKPFWKLAVAISAGDLEKQLRSVPQVDLDPDYMKRTKQQIAAKAKEIAAANLRQNDFFVRKLINDRPDLAGMPFLLGQDCSLSAAQTRELAARSIDIRSALGRASRGRTTSPGSGYPFWNKLELNWLRPEAVPALRQMLLAEDAEIRGQTIDILGRINDAKATETLANVAIFDVDPSLREAALTHLRKRPVEQYRTVLMRGLRHPWQPVVGHAVEAIVSLEPKALAPDLVALLDEPHPAAPISTRSGDGQPKIVVRELVRVNHHRNCLLCHPPIMDNVSFRTTPLGPAPSPQDPLPPSLSSEYYSRQPQGTLVRADITYLRQDFSLQQKVDEPGKWSETQRFDFFVRTRELAQNEQPPAPDKALAEYRGLIVEALRALTGKDAAPTAQAWRTALAQPAARVEAKAKATR